MKKILMLLFLFSINLISQSYFNINYSNLEPTNSTPLGNMNKITFSETSITFHLNDNSTIDKNILFIQNCTFSDIDYGNPLPVELTSFNANINENSVLLTWQTATEVNTYGFEIERNVAQNAILSNWETIGFVEGYGNSNSPKEYTFIDKPIPNLDPATSDKQPLSYRLKQIDTDGTFTYSEIVTVETIHASSLPTEFVLFQNYPNPFNPITTIKYSIPGNEYVSLKIYDTLGNEIATLVNGQKEPGNYNLNFDASNFASGVYIYRLKAGNFNSVKKLIIVK